MHLLIKYIVRHSIALGLNITGVQWSMHDSPL